MIHIIKHKAYDNPKPEGYTELNVGPLFEGERENINYLNPVINELTGIYDVWKNESDEIVGFCHYHRFFENPQTRDYLTLEDAESLLKGFDILVCYSVDYMDISLEQQLAIDFREDLRTYFKLMNRLYEKEPDLQLYFDLRWFYPRNMFVCRREHLNDFCEWLFPLLIPIAEDFLKEDYPKYQHYYNRMIGFIAERLLSYWINKEGLISRELPYKELP